MRAIILLPCLALAACGVGLGTEVRKDITAQMEKAKAPITGCYAERLKANRKLKGTIIIHAVAAPSTGQFSEVKIVEDELGDPDLTDCVFGEVSKLKLDKPTKTKISFKYPLFFQPTK